MTGGKLPPLGQEGLGVGHLELTYKKPVHSGVCDVVLRFFVYWNSFWENIYKYSIYIYLFIIVYICML